MENFTEILTSVCTLIKNDSSVLYCENNIKVQETMNKLCGDYSEYNIDRLKLKLHKNPYKIFPVLDDVAFTGVNTRSILDFLKTINKIFPQVEPYKIFGHTKYNLESRTFIWIEIDNSGNISIKSAGEIPKYKKLVFDLDSYYYSTQLDIIIEKIILLKISDIIKYSQKQVQKKQEEIDEINHIIIELYPKIKSSLC